MLEVKYEDLLKTIVEKSGESKENVEAKIKEKLDQLSGLISQEGAAHIVANELGVKLEQQPAAAQGGKLQVKNLLAGMRDVELDAKIIQAYELREFNSNGRSGKVANCLIGDETGTTRLVMWGDQAETVNKVKPGDIVQVKSSYAKENQGRVEIHANEKSQIMVNPTGVTIGEVPSSANAVPASRKSIKELTENDSFAEILGTVVQAYEPRFFERKNTPTPETSYVMNVVVDDGSDSMRVAFFGDQAAVLVGKTNEQMLAFKENPVEFEPLKTDLLGTILKISGRVKKNEMFDRLEFTARQVVVDPDPTEETKNE